jgi:pyrimidine and pyridine-specific 5'-nucleotidase
VRHHQVDPLEYNAQVDDALPLEEVLAVDSELIDLLEDVDSSKVKLWLFTNAYVNHAKRCIRLIGVDKRRNGPQENGGALAVNGESKAEEVDGEEYGYFEGLTYCDYGAATNIDPETGEMEGFVCKPHPRMFEKAMREAGVADPKACYFVGMSFAFSFLFCYTDVCSKRPLFAVDMMPLYRSGQDVAYDIVWL